MGFDIALLRALELLNVTDCPPPGLNPSTGIGALASSLGCLLMLILSGAGFVIFDAKILSLSRLYSIKSFISRS